MQKGKENRENKGDDFCNIDKDQAIVKKGIIN